MMLRDALKSKRNLADNCDAAKQRFSTPFLHAMVEVATRLAHGFMRIPSFYHTPSYCGQQAGPSATLPVLFGFILVSDTRREPNSGSGVITSDKVKKGLRAWGHLKLFSHLLRRQASQLAVIRFHNRQPLALLSGQGRPFLPAALCCKVQPSALALVLLRARQNWWTATDLNIGRTAPSFFNALPLLASCQRGVLRSDTSFKIQKGLANV